MIIRVNLKTKEKTFIEPINEKDETTIKKIYKALFYENKKSSDTSVKEGDVICAG